MGLKLAQSECSRMNVPMMSLVRINLGSIEYVCFPKVWGKMQGQKNKEEK